MLRTASSTVMPSSIAWSGSTIAMRAVYWRVALSVIGASSRTRPNLLQSQLRNTDDDFAVAVGSNRGNGLAGLDDLADFVAKLGDDAGLRREQQCVRVLVARERELRFGSGQLRARFPSARDRGRTRPD